jgi:hypothetical protein
MRIRLQCKERAPGGGSPAGTQLAEAAYTFIEVLVTAVLLGLVGTTLYGALAGGFCLIQSTREDLRATQIMMQKLEAIRLFTWSQINDTNNYLTPAFVEPYDPLGITNNCGGAQYKGYLQASVPATGELPEAYRTNMRTITVTLYWTNYNGRKITVHRREMQTRVARSGMQNYIWGAL